MQVGDPTVSTTPRPVAAAQASSDRGLAIVVNDLHIDFKIYEERRLDLRELVARGLRSRSATVVHAVRGISFTVQVGESIGILGSNGSGKSTTLRAIAGLEAPTSGEVLVRHQPQLLGVGSVLKPMLSGTRNIILGGLALGMTLDDIEARIDEVVAFAGLEKAINRPLRTYSSGMRARLAFSIATLRTPEILLIDEALAVGDRSFRNRSLERLRQIQANAGTIVMVTHNLGEIQKTCDRAIWLEEGEVLADGPTDEVIEQYEASEPE